MISRNILLLPIFFIACFADTIDNNTTNNDVPSQNALQLVDPQTGVVTWNKYTISATVLAVVLVVVGVYALIALFMPLVTYKLCYIFGYCPYSLPNYIDEYLQTAQGQPREKRSSEYLNTLTDTLVKAYEMYGEYLKPEENEEQRDKRQADYLGPLMHTLAVAYEKYQDGNPKKNFQNGTPYIK